MSAGIPYDSREGRAIAGAITAVLTGISYATSAEMAGELGAFPRFEANRDAMLRVIRNHRRAAYGEAAGYEGLATPPVALDHEAILDKELVGSGEGGLGPGALARRTSYGYRNAQASVIAPTGTIGLLMDCDTTGVEPDFALVKFKKLAGGGYFKIINRCVPEALKTLGYSPDEIEEIVRYAVGHGTLEGSNALSHGALRAKGFGDAQIAAVENALEQAFDIRFVFNKWTLGEEFCVNTLGMPATQLDAPDFDMLKALGFAKAEVEAANLYVCGAMTLEGAPYLKPEHLPVFDCANPCGRIGKRSHVRGKPHPHAGRLPALHLGRHLQDHQHAQRGDGEGLRRILSAVVEARAEGERALSRRLQAVAASGLPGPAIGRRGRRCRGSDRSAAGGARHHRHRTHRREDHRARARARASAKGCRTAARATPKRRSSAATRSICAPANMRTAAPAKSSSTCTRRAPPSAR